MLELLLVDRCPTRMSSIFGQWGSLGSFGWVMRAFYSYYVPRIALTQVDAVGCKVSGPTVRMSIDSTVFLCVCVPLERETERERKRKREKEREREREREREKRGERGLPQRTCHRFTPSCFFIFFAHENKPLSHQSRDSAPICAGAYMHAQWRLSWRHH